MPFWAWCLLSLWALLLFGGFVTGSPQPTAPRRIPTAARMLSSFTLVLAAAGWTWVARGTAAPVGTMMTLIALGMVCGWLGDITLAGLLPLSTPTLVGMALFGIGHVAYIAGLMLAATDLALLDEHAWTIALITWALVALVGWYVVVWRGSQPTLLHRAALPYALLLATTAAVSSAMALQSVPFVAVAVGAGLFLLSDLVLAGELFGGLDFPSIGDVVWLLYGPGQALIVFGAGILTQRAVA